jgi:aminopeptidase N
MKTDTHKTIYLKDYTPYPYTIKHIDLTFDIRDGETAVKSKIAFKGKGEPLVLNGEDLLLKSISLNGKPLTDYTADEKSLTVIKPPSGEFTLETEVVIQPEKNTRLEGLYQSGGNYCTQCEAEGFRRITYYPDRPDVMTTYTVRLEADKKYPVLLSNGNLMDKGDLKDGRHYAVWNDPFPKPCYLFALVAGNLAEIHDTYKTTSGRKVDLYIYVRHGDEQQCGWAMESLKRSMKWDEDVYGLEYDLDIFNIVAVSDFNMGAMENKSLNIFNTALVLAQQETATDDDFIRVEGVIAHEYFHNWSGDRVTCRDWFQLSLKEGLTVFRDQEFTADLHSRTVARIDDVAHLRRSQFPEDAGPLAHPIRPDNYIEINNFYTMTVYEKGAEVIRMIRTILGTKNYRKGTDLYFTRHDGQAVTCEDFVKCMEDASGIDLKHFRLWYEQAGTPEITFEGAYDEKAKTYTVTLSQNVPSTPGQLKKKPMQIPIAIGLINANGKDMELDKGQSTKILNLTESKQTFVIPDVDSKPVPSVLRNFSAPVKLKSSVSDSDLAFLMVHDSDGFNRWEAGQTYALRVINKILDEKTGTPPEFLKAFGGTLYDASRGGMDKAFFARALSLPDVSYIGHGREESDPPAIYKVREQIIRDIYAANKDGLAKLYDANRTGSAFSLTPEAMGQRALQNVLLRYLSVTKDEDSAKLAKAQYDSANNMTDRVAALSVLSNTNSKLRDEAFVDFYHRFKEHQLVIDKWFALQAAAIRPDTIESIKALRTHPEFNIKNPNRVRSLYASFAMNNPVTFHAADGSGYEFLTNAVIELNTINPQIASRLLGPMREWRRYTQDRQKKMQESLQRILDTPKLSPDVYEIASKSIKH